MGFRCRWSAARLDRALVFERLKLDVVREHQEPIYDTGLWAVTLPSGWTVVMGDGWDFMDLLSEADARALSAAGETLFFFTEDSAMVTSLAAYREGRAVWSLAYEAEARAPKVEGAPPEVVRTTLAACAAEQAAEGEGGADFVYDATPRIGLALTGFRHDDTLSHGEGLTIHQVARAAVAPSVEPSSVAASSLLAQEGAVRPIVVELRQVVALGAEEICARILDVEQWRTFRGWGPLPGIRAARFRERTEAIVGSAIAVENDDGSTHVERVVRWEPGVAVSFRFEELSRPVRTFATHFVETWTFAPAPDGRTTSVRRMELYPRGLLGRIVLAVVAPMMRRALLRHVRELEERDATGAR